MRPILFLFVFALANLTLQAQNQPDPPHHDWHASWITHPTAPLREPLVLHFRRSLTLTAVPANYIVRVSADNRFILYVNGKRAGDGPARGDLTHWRYERFDLAPFLQQGENLVTATVWNWGVFAPVAQMSDRTAFLLESEGTGDTSISTGVGGTGENNSGGWQVEVEPGHRPLDRHSVSFLTYFASGPGEEIDAARYDWNWQSPTAGGAGWVPAGSPMRDSMFPSVSKAHSADTTGDNFWGLVPDELPHMEYAATDVGRVRRTSLLFQKDRNAAPLEVSAIENAMASFPTTRPTIPPSTHAHMILDRETLTTAYPQLTVSGGKGSHIVLTYAEALYDKDQHKGDRDDVGDRKALGLTDSFLPDGDQHRTFEPLWWRTWRYLDLDITTGDQPLTLESLTAQFTAYPFKELATFKSPDHDLTKIWDISWRTARDDAHETYMDTPYYEQLQYIGDTRIQALMSYAVAGDDRLARQAIQAFDQSRTPDGITRSRYPSSLPQSIPTFSLLWIGMVHDYWMYRPDPELVRSSLPGTRTVLDWFANYEQPDGLLRELPWWSFIDWVSKGEIPTYDASHESCVTTLEYLGALGEAADLEKAVGDPLLASRYQMRAGHVRSGLYEKCWSASHGLIADNPDQKIFSQQANILAVLYDVIPKDRRQDALRRMLAIDPGTTPDGVMSASYYFRFYLARALDHAGLAGEYLKSIGPWRALLPLHFSTWPETPGETRSDSHAWSAHPIYDLLTLVAGIEPASPGFATVRIAPHMGNLPSLSATFPHPQGEIRVEYHYADEHGDPQTTGGSTFRADVTLPGSVTGTFQFDGRSWVLKAGPNRIDIPMK
jgi:alpha-L-rhamnosidase